MARSNALPRPTRFPGTPTPELHVGKFAWDFAVDGGAVGAIVLPGAFPAGAIIIDGLYDVITTCTTASGDTGTGALHIKAANDLLVAVAVGTGTPFDAGLQKLVPTPATAASMIKLTADSRVTFTIAVAAFTAGRFVGYVRYVMGDALLYS